MLILCLRNLQAAGICYANDDMNNVTLYISVMDKALGRAALYIYYTFCISVCLRVSGWWCVISVPFGLKKKLLELA